MGLDAKIVKVSFYCQLKMLISFSSSLSPFLKEEVNEGNQKPAYLKQSEGLQQ